MKSGNAPESPNPEVTIPLQGRENRRTFDYTTRASRVNEFGPMGSTTWQETPRFDNEGYQRAISQYLAAGGQAPAEGWYTPPSGTSSIPSIPSSGSGRMRIMMAGEGDSVGGGETGPGPGGPVGGPPGESGPGSGPGDPASTGGAGGPTDTSTSGRSGGSTSPFGAVSNQPDYHDFLSSTWTRRQVLSPEQQALYESSVGNQQGIQGQIAQLLNRGGGDFSSYTDRLNSLDPRTFASDAADAAYRASTRYLDPQREAEKRALEARLADQGFVPGTPGYAQAMDQFMQSGERAYADARDRAIGQGYTFGGQQFGQSLEGIQAALASALAERSRPINELNALRTGAGVATPQLGQGQAQTPGMNPVDVLGQFGQQYQGRLAGYNAGVSQDNATMAAIASLLAAFGSDIELKTDLIPTGEETRDGIPVYLFRYKGGKKVYRGVIAQDVQKVKPHAVCTLPSGFLGVIYGML